mmetsp:Transcript_26002/g.68231  ORF Transcript_26002/g.68231 Transcript_26002/m.68231 type:complete len:369 (+) Transcript_26002:299-1405(+)
MIQDESHAAQRRGVKRGGSESSSDDSDVGKVDWQVDKDQKPPQSYAMLIYMTIKHHGGGKVTLAQVYEYILSNFAYYRHADPGWKNSIRHNLTQHKCFLKVPRAVGEPGKGGFWALDPAYIKVFESGTFKGTGRRIPNRKRLNPPSGSGGRRHSYHKASIADDHARAAAKAAHFHPQQAAAVAHYVDQAEPVPSTDLFVSDFDEDLTLVEVLSAGLPGGDADSAGFFTDARLHKGDASVHETGMAASAAKRRRVDTPLSSLAEPRVAHSAIQSERFDYSFIEDFCVTEESSVFQDSTSVKDPLSMAWPSDDIWAPTALLDRFRAEVQQERFGVLDQRQLFDYPLAVADDFLLPPVSTVRATSPIVQPV